MKYKIFVICLILIAAMLFGACDRIGSGQSTGEKNLSKDASYAMGMSIGMEFAENMISGSITPDVDEFIKGISDVMKGKRTRFDILEASEILEIAFTSIMQERNAAAAQEEITFLAGNAGKSGINITASGLQYEIISEGSGPRPSAADSVRVHYEGSLIDGTVFDSSYSRGTPEEFPLNVVIPGWSEGLQLMNAGSQFVFYIPSDLGYGPGGWGPIPPYATLIFVVDLLEIIN